MLGVASHTETEAPRVVYRPLYDSDYELFARPYVMLAEEGTIHGEMEPRFENVDG